MHAYPMLQNQRGSQKTFLTVFGNRIRRQTESRFWTDARFRQKPQLLHPPLNVLQRA